MNRRELVKLSLASLVAALVPGGTRTWGYVDVARHARLMRSGILLKVFCNGKEITNHCYEFDDRLGRCGVFKCDENGRHYYDRDADGVARETITDFEVVAVEIDGKELLHYIVPHVRRAAQEYGLA
jgi:hypothetical protein